MASLVIPFLLESHPNFWINTWIAHVNYGSPGFADKFAFSLYSILIALKILGNLWRQESLLNIGSGLRFGYKVIQMNILSICSYSHRIVFIDLHRNGNENIIPGHSKLILHVCECSCSWEVPLMPSYFSYLHLHQPEETSRNGPLTATKAHLILHPTLHPTSWNANTLHSCSKLHCKVLFHQRHYHSFLLAILS